MTPTRSTLFASMNNNTSHISKSLHRKSPSSKVISFASVHHHTPRRIVPSAEQLHKLSKENVAMKHLVHEMNTHIHELETDTVKLEEENVRMVGVIEALRDPTKNPHTRHLSKNVCVLEQQISSFHSSECKTQNEIKTIQQHLSVVRSDLNAAILEKKAAAEQLEAKLKEHTDLKRDFDALLKRLEQQTLSNDELRNVMLAMESNLRHEVALRDERIRQLQQMASDQAQDYHSRVFALQSKIDALKLSTFDGLSLKQELEECSTSHESQAQIDEMPTITEQLPAENRCDELSKQVEGLLTQNLMLENAQIEKPECTNDDLQTQYVSECEAQIEALEYSLRCRDAAINELNFELEKCERLRARLPPSSYCKLASFATLFAHAHMIDLSTQYI